MRIGRPTSWLLLLTASMVVSACSALVEAEFTEVIAQLVLSPDPMVQLPGDFIQGVPGTVTFQVETNECTEVSRTTVEELGLHERLVTAWVDAIDGVTGPCRGPEPRLVSTEVTFYSAGPATVVIRANGEDRGVRDYEFPTDVLPR